MFRVVRLVLNDGILWIVTARTFGLRVTAVIAADIGFQHNIVRLQAELRNSSRLGDDDRIALDRFFYADFLGSSGWFEASNVFTVSLVAASAPDSCNTNFPIKTICIIRAS
jgi:hypothetical protein